MTKYNFADVEDELRHPELERDGVKLPLGKGRWVKIRAATEVNPMWRSRSPRISAELNRLKNAEADPLLVQRYLARQYAEALIVDWGGIKVKAANGEEIEVPFAVDACIEFLMTSRRCYKIIDGFVWNDENYTSAEFELKVEEVKN